MTQFLKAHGILHQMSCPYTPSQKGVSEYKHKHIIETTIALLHHSSMPLHPTATPPPLSEPHVVQSQPIQPSNPNLSSLNLPLINKLLLLQSSMLQCLMSIMLFLVKKTSNDILILLVYVDDILLIGSSSLLLQELIGQMHVALAMKELGNISYFLGVSIQTMGANYFLFQQKYASEILLKVGMTSCEPCNSPISVKPAVTLVSSLRFAQPQLYRSLVGALQYLTITRTDLSLAVNQACQHMHDPTNGNFSIVKRILRFVKGSLSYGLTFSPSSFELQAFSDSNWAGDHLDRRSTSSYCIYLGSNLMLLHDLHLPTTSSHILWCDNLSAIALASNSVFHTRSKYIEIDCHFIREKVAAKKVALKYVPSVDQIVDIFYKTFIQFQISISQDQVVGHFLSHQLAVD
ncbi:uncharacterized protein LOC114320328 [Camellia sinensis]|uniref:uncharacterized protein LOC114320328 n=1 Tax=Camellia sinensis TaxID=4442 RepID=UPI0010367500|nr:uncharacterized protein LOC114320328 [Camellia sinensis]